MSQRISQFTQIVTLASGDYFPVIQTSGTTNKSVQVGALDQRYFVVASGNKAQSTADSALSSGTAALASGNAALISAATAQASGIVAQASGNAALSRAGGTMTGPIVFASGQQINTAVNLSGGISGAVPYQSAPSLTTFLSPGVSGQVLTTAGSGLAPLWTTGGKILQAVQGSLTAGFTSNSTSYVDTGLTVNITPSSTSSRVLLLVNGNNVQTGSRGAYLTIFRNGVNVVGVDYYLYLMDTGGGLNQAYPAQFNYIDSPTTTSSITYTVYARAITANNFTFNSMNTYNQIAVLNALEIAP